MCETSIKDKESGYSAIQDNNNPKEKEMKRKEKYTKIHPTERTKKEEILTCRERMDRISIHDAGSLHLDETANRNAIDTGANRARQATRRLLPMDLGSSSRCR